VEFRERGHDAGDPGTGLILGPEQDMLTNWKLEGAILVEEIELHVVDVLGNTLDIRQPIEPEVPKLLKFSLRKSDFRLIGLFELEALKLGGALELTLGSSK